MSWVPSFEEGYCCLMGLGSTAVYNMLTYRPIKSRPWLYLVSGGAGFVFGSFVADKHYKKIVAREVYIEEYIKQHPEDFPVTEPVKWKNVLQPWYPVR